MHPLLTLNFLRHMVWCCHVIGPILLKTAFCAHRFFNSFAASDGSEGTTAGSVVSLRSIVVRCGFRS